jgi:predicted anti-sigma-YlaC factor YlaD
MRTQQREVRRGSIRSVAVATSQEPHGQRLLMMSAYLIASAIIALWMAYWPTVTGSILTTLNALPQHLTEASYTVNHLNQGDRLTVRFDDRWSLSKRPKS